MRTTVRIGGQVVVVRDGTLEIEHAIEERSSCRFAVVDEAGAWRFHKGEQVIVTDNATGETLFGGVIESVNEEPLSDEGGLLHDVTAADWHYLADKRIVATSYENRTAGAIVGDIVTRYLGAEGVRGGAVTADWDTATDWQAGTFAGTIGTAEGDIELGTAGDDVSRVESGPAGLSTGTLVGVAPSSQGIGILSAWRPTFTRVSSAYLPTGQSVAANQPRYLGAIHGDGLMIEEGSLRWSFSMSGSYHYVDLTNVPDYTIQSGDRLHYDVIWYESGNSQIAFDMSGPLGNLRDSGAVDQNGLGVHPATDLSSRAGQRWYHREINLAPLVGKTMDRFMVACERNGPATVTGAVRNIVIVGPSGEVRHKIWASGDATPTTAVSASDGSNSYSVTRVQPETCTIPAEAMPTGITGTIEFWMMPLTAHYAPYGGSTSPTDTYWNLLTWGSLTGDGFLLRRGVTSGQNRLELIQHEPGVGLVTYSSAMTFSQFGVYHIAVAWNAFSTRVYVNGSPVIITGTGFVVPSSSALTLGRPGGYRAPNAVYDDLRISRVRRSDAEIAARWNNGFPTIAPIDRETTYKLTFDGTLAAGQGGYRIWPALDLSPAVVARSSQIDWEASEPAGTDVIVEVSTDGGATWQVATDGGPIPGVSAGTNLSGKRLLVRQTLTTNDNGTTPEVVMVSASVASGYAAQGTWESPPVALAPAARFGKGTVTGAVTAPAGTAVTFETSADGGQTWQMVGPDGAIASLAEGADLENVSLRVRARLTSNGATTPEVHAIAVEVLSATIADGPVIGGAVFNYITAAEAISRLAERAGFWWMIDPDRVVWFQPRDAHVAPWAVTDADILRGTAVATEEAPKYRNRQYLVGVQVKTDPQVETVKGDGDTRAFTVGYPIAEEPSQIRVFRSGGTVETFGPDEIGVKGVEDGKAWYWSKGDPVVTQDEGQPVVGANERVEITYRGQFQMVVVSEDPGAVSQRRALEGVGTGIVEDVSDAPSITTQRDAYDTAGAMLAKWARVGRVFAFATRRAGLAPGQLVTVDQPDFGMHGDELLVRRVVIREDYAGLVYEVEAVSGPAAGSWASLFASIAAQAAGYIERLSSDRNETVIVTAPFAETWAWTETSGVTVAACLVPATDVYPSTSAYPC